MAAFVFNHDEKEALAPPVSANANWVGALGTAAKEFVTVYDDPSLRQTDKIYGRADIDALVQEGSQKIKGKSPLEFEDNQIKPDLSWRELVKYIRRVALYAPVARHEIND